MIGIQKLMNDIVGMDSFRLIEVVIFEEDYVFNDWVVSNVQKCIGIQSWRDEIVILKGLYLIMMLLILTHVIVMFTIWFAYLIICFHVLYDTLYFLEKKSTMSMMSREIICMPVTFKFVIGTVMISTKKVALSVILCSGSTSNIDNI